METVFTSPHEIERDVQRLAASGYVAVHLDRNAKLCIAHDSLSSCTGVARYNIAPKFKAGTQEWLETSGAGNTK